MAVAIDQTHLSVERQRNSFNTVMDDKWVSPGLYITLLEKDDPS